MARNRILKTIVSVFTMLALLITIAGCSITGEPASEPASGDLMNGIKPRTVSDRPADKRFVTSQTDLALKLFRSSLEKSKGENVLLSPLSILLALSMTANGADGQTKAEMEKLLGGDIPLEELNKYVHTYLSKLSSNDSCRYASANSIWFRDDQSFKVND